MRTIAAARDRDRFCDLTDDLLWHVLSFLPSDVALQTCVLDTWWRGLWRRATSLLLVFEESSCIWSHERFQQLAKLVIHLRGHSPLVKCVINVYPDEGTFTNTTELLIDYALACQTKVLVLSPAVVLDLYPPGVDVPVISQHLKTIHLFWIALQCSDLNFWGCPVLEDLKIESCIISVRKISSKSLKRLCITDCCRVPLDFHIRIFTPDLISLQLNDFDGLTPLLEDMPFLETAYIGLVNRCQDFCDDNQRGCASANCGCHDYPVEEGVVLNGLSNAVNLELIAEPEMFIYKWDLEWCPIFSNLKTLLLNEWFTTVELVYILQYSPLLEMLTLQIGDKKNLTGATGTQGTIEQSFVCAHLKVVNIECKNVDEGIRKILKILSTCGILSDHISIKALSSPSCYFSFQKPPHNYTCGPSCSYH